MRSEAEGNGRLAMRAMEMAPLLIALWSAGALVRGDMRWEHVAIVAAVPAALLWGPRSRALLGALFPFGLLGVVYDGLHLLGPPSAHVRVCEVRDLDASLFGASGQTVHDWIQSNPSAWVERLCAIPYGTFIFVSVAFALGLHLRGEPLLARQFGWSCLLVSVTGLVIHRAFPTAPPWYFHTHGCAVDAGARASEGPGLARVDAWMGFPYFARLYGRSSEVFGSLPSLHVTYPALMTLASWRPARSRWVVAAYAGWMCVAAVYLDHHWVIDVCTGVLLAWLGWRAVSLLGPAARRCAT